MSQGRWSAVKGFLRQHWFARLCLKPLCIVYVLFFLFALSCGEWLIYFPGSPSYQDDQQSLKLRTSDGVQITARYFPNPDARYTILYSHGNGEDLGDDAWVHELLHGSGFAVFAYDYHGYGTSQGSPNEANLYRDIDAAYDYMTKTLAIPPERIIVYGRSLGGGPSVDLAARCPAAGLVLESTFMSAYRTRTQIPLLPFDKYNSLAKIPRVRCPVLVMHGTADPVIGCSHGRALFAAARGPKQCLWVPGANHDNLVDVAGERYVAALGRFRSLLERQASKQ